MSKSSKIGIFTSFIDWLPLSFQSCTNCFQMSFYQLSKVRIFHVSYPNIAVKVAQNSILENKIFSLLWSKNCFNCHQYSTIDKVSWLLYYPTLHTTSADFILHQLTSTVNKQLTNSSKKQWSFADIKLLYGVYTL